ncbi:MAG TPA: PAS domain S-box protein, partial [Acetobacteraceae bacterium]|nr:PAS domain S-box protein [Acetobacteraceae bacterium]
AEASEARLLLAQEVGQIGTWETDIATGRRHWSQQQFLLYGLDPAGEPPHGAAWPAMVHPEDRARVVATITRAHAAPTAYQHEFRIVRPDGVVRWLRTAGRSEFRNGHAPRLLGIAFDTTERHETERALLESTARLEAEVAARTRELVESEERFRTYFEYSGDALVVVRVEAEDRFAFESINRAGERLTGLRRQDVIGKTPAQVLLPETAQRTVEAYREVVRGGAPVRVERSLALPSGTFELETVLVPVWDAAGERVIRIISGQRDLTERRRIESRLAHSQRLEAVGQLTGGVAHDFNNLLTVIIGNLALLRGHIGRDQRASRYLESVENAADRGARLTASLLAFSRRQALQLQPIDVGAQLRESVTLLRRALGEEIDLSLTIAAGLPLARADATQLEAAVLNLALNARDAILEAADALGRKDGALRIQVCEAVLLAADLEGNDEARPGRFVAVELKDSGIGMTANVREHAFEPFFTTKAIGKGTGLGLSQVFGFVRQLGGHVTLDSTAGQGTRVVMYLPVASVGGQTRAEPPAPPIPLPAGARVLVVEDDENIREVTAEVLREAGLEVLTAEDGTSALEVLERGERVDILFSDVVMPGGATGLDLARAARALRPGLCVLLTSGYGGPALSRYGAEGEYEVLAKPYTRTVLLERLSHMLTAEPTG